ncbi:F0F1 ATP synthase assembly protein I [Thalassotalea sp. M1531]|uniref:F0F1 ATP synthase assembly protein I n=1 Tax=Thalassotalea algicola TaxID=2716224 RepID=A0A7Y0LBS5_9GAMM|nr:ATP synthase subunit I [Thalassotalea algicola]NMP30796.1 F0F1 ATP synthase assembly protein I [Thalassotalea algicola]
MNQLVKPGRKLSRQQLIFASSLVLVSTVTIFLSWGLSHAQSALAGGCIGVIPNFVFALYAFRFAGASASKQVMDSFFKGAKIKMVLTALLFALSFKFLSISLVPFFSTYILAVVSPILYTALSKFTFNQQ